MAKSKAEKVRFAVALILYLILALIATFVLDGIVRTALWLFFIYLAIKTIVAYNDDRTMD